MARADPDNFESLLKEHKFKVVSGTQTKGIMCIICSELKMNLYQTHCECIYCHDCITSCLEGGDKHCRGGKKECEYYHLELGNTVMKNHLIDMRVPRVRVHCVHESCEFTSELMKMAEHKRVCTKQPIECPYKKFGCDKEGSFKDRIEAHLKDDSLRHSELLVEVIDSHRNEVAALRDDLARSNSVVEALRERLASQAGEGVSEVEARMVAAMERLRGELSGDAGAQMRELGERSARMEGELADLGVKYGKVAGLEAAMAALATEVTEGSSNMQNELSTLRAEAAKHRDDSRARLARVEATAAEKLRKSAAATAVAMGEDRQRVVALQQAVAALDIGTNRTVVIGELTLMVEGFSARRASEELQLSPHFYSHTNGYKLQAQVYAGGSGAGRGTHVSVYLVVCRGEYDTILGWPCRHTVTAAVVNQRTQEAHKTLTAKYGVTVRACYERPGEQDNSPRGWATFVSHEDLAATDGLVVGDAVMLHIVVAPPL